MTRRLLAATASFFAVLALGAPIAHADFGLLKPDVTFTSATGAAQMLAGSHPFATNVGFQLPRREPEAGVVFQEGSVKDVFAELPPGFIGNPTATPRCTGREFAKITKSISQPACPDNSALGLITAEIQISPGNPPVEYTVPIYNLVPPPGNAVKLGFVVFSVPVTIEGGLSQEAPYAVRSGAANISQAVGFYASKLVLWGDPANPIHDPLRGHCVDATFKSTGGVPQSLGNCPYTGSRRLAFITLPTSCRGPQNTTFEADSWQQPGPPFLRYEVLTNDAAISPQPAGFTGCENVGFSPSVANRPTSKSAESSSGLDFALDVEGQDGLLDPSETAVADSAIEKVAVTLPEGVYTNPSVATGLAACTLAEYDAQKLGGQGGCPEASRVGTVEVESPVLEEEVGDPESEVEPALAPHPLRGSIYVAKQHDNVFDNLLTIYMVIEDPRFGIFIKLPGRVEPDPSTGQLTTTFGEPGHELPQLPFSHFRLHFREGDRAPLVTPATCGTFATEAVLYPYADPANPLHQTATFEVNSGAGGSPCASQVSQLPSTQSFSAGTVDPKAGAYSPFVLELSRPDGSQQLRSLSATLPQGLLGKLAGIPYCPEAQIAQAEARSGEGQGAVEISQPSCPQASEVGTVVATAGAGTEPLYVNGRAYLAGPYAGAPLSLEIVTPAIAGPFDLGVVAVRTALHVDPLTSQITAVSDSIPTILHGLPLDLRSIAVDMSRADFTLNPTSCEPKSITGSAVTTLGTITPLSQYFQASQCDALKFAPKLKLSLSGQTGRTGNPTLKAVLTQPSGANSNFAKTSVVLPKGLFIDNSHLSNPCTRVQFNESALPGERCPARSVLGSAKVWTPLLDQPEEGNVYFRSNGGERELPDLVIGFRGQIPVQLVGFIDSVKVKRSEVRSVRTRFQTVPDAPVTRFELRLKGGKEGLLENSRDLCKSTNRATLKLTGQNGKVQDSKPIVNVQCRKGPRKNAKGHGKSKSRSRRAVLFPW